MQVGKKLHFHPDKPVSWSLTLPTSNIYITLYFNVSSTLLRKNRNTDFLYIYIYFYIGFYEKSSLSIIISSLFIYFSWHVCKVANWLRTLTMLNKGYWIVLCTKIHQILISLRNKYSCHMQKQVLVIIEY